MIHLSRSCFANSSEFDAAIVAVTDFGDESDIVDFNLFWLSF